MAPTKNPLSLSAQGLTEQQRIFVREFAKSGDKVTAAVEAGYSKHGIHNTTSDLLRLPVVVRAIQIETAKRLAAAAPVALRVIERLVSDEATHPKIRLDAAKTILDRAGYIGPKAREADKSGDQPLHELSTDELRALAGRLEAEIAGRARDVTPNEADDPDNPLTMLD